MRRYNSANFGASEYCEFTLAVATVARSQPNGFGRWLSDRARYVQSHAGCVANNCEAPDRICATIKRMKTATALCVMVTK